ncbi:hypothetical protein R3P38DRAFT_2834661, partial [Favolaschia claudopus]
SKPPAESHHLYIFLYPILMCTSPCAHHPSAVNSKCAGQLRDSVTYRDPQCCHCGLRGSHSSSCPFYNPATCSSRHPVWDTRLESVINCCPL